MALKPSTSATLSRRYSRLREIVRWQGLKGLKFRLLLAAGYRSAGWYVRPLDQPVRPALPTVPAVIRPLLLSDWEQYRGLRLEMSHVEFRRRLDRTHLCFGAWIRGKLASVTWVGRGLTHIAFFSKDITLGSGEIYLYDAFTDPPHRGQRLQPAIVAEILRHFTEQGYTRAFSLIGLHNRSNVLVRERAGFCRVGMMAQIRLGLIQKDIFRGSRV